MAFELPPLPYPLHALEPYISSETLQYHHGKHHRAYVTKLNELITNTEFSKKSLEEIILESKEGIFNNAAQAWNHTFYWHCMSPDNQKPPATVLTALNETFGSLESFKEKFMQAANTQFGSGWAWLVKNKSNQLEILSTSNAGNPLTEGKKPLLTCDVWEHAYYIDTRNERPKYVTNFWHLINWDFVLENFKSA